MADNTIKGFRHRVKTGVHGETPGVRARGTVRVKPKRVKGPANDPNLLKLGGLPKAAAGLHKLVATRTDVPQSGGIAGRNLDALKSKLLGGNANPVDALLAKLNGMASDREASAFLAEEFIRAGVKVEVA